MHDVDIDDDLKLSEREPSIRIRVSKVKHLVNVRLLNKINNIFRLDIYLNYLPAVLLDLVELRQFFFEIFLFLCYFIKLKLLPLWRIGKIRHSKTKGGGGGIEIH